MHKKVVVFLILLIGYPIYLKYNFNNYVYASGFGKEKIVLKDDTDTSTNSEDFISFDKNPQIKKMIGESISNEIVNDMINEASRIKDYRMHQEGLNQHYDKEINNIAQGIRPFQMTKEAHKGFIAQEAQPLREQSLRENKRWNQERASLEFINKVVKKVVDDAAEAGEIKKITEKIIDDEISDEPISDDTDKSSSDHDSSSIIKKDSFTGNKFFPELSELDKKITENHTKQVLKDSLTFVKDVNKNLPIDDGTKELTEAKDELTKSEKQAEELFSKTLKELMEFHEKYEKHEEKDVDDAIEEFKDMIDSIDTSYLQVKKDIKEAPKDDGIQPEVKDYVNYLVKTVVKYTENEFPPKGEQHYDADESDAGSGYESSSTTEIDSSSPEWIESDASSTGIPEPPPPPKSSPMPSDWTEFDSDRINTSEGEAAAKEVDKMLEQEKQLGHQQDIIDSHIDNQIENKIADEDFDDDVDEDLDEDLETDTGSDMSNSEHNTDSILLMDHPSHLDRMALMGGFMRIIRWFTK